MYKDGKSVQIKHWDEYTGEMKIYEIFFYIMNDGSGYLWMFENRTQKTYFDGTYQFKLDNMKIEGDEGAIEWRIKLGPGERIFKWLKMVDLTQSWGYKYSYSFKCREAISDEKTLIRKIKERGKKKQISYHGQLEEIYYWILFMEEWYFWYYENNTNKHFRAKYNFVL